MDFVRLALREVKKNSSRTGIAIAATALATVILVLSRIVPQGYMRNQAIAERIFAGADILIWPAPAHVYVDEQSDLEWRAWKGEDWQSYAEYFMPSLPGEGYVSPSASLPWRPLNLSEVSALVKEVGGVASVEPYLSYPCKVQIGSDSVDAILRGRTAGEPGDPLAHDGQIKSGRPLGPSDRGSMNALVPLVSEPAIHYTSGIDLEITVTWPGSQTKKVALSPVGAYVVKIGEIPGVPGPSGSASEPIPVYWKRPEIVVSAETFAALAPPGHGVYQLNVRAERPSEIRALVERLRDKLGLDYAVYSIVDLVSIKDSGQSQQVVAKDMSGLVTAMILTMAAGIVAGSVYVLLAVQTRKIGLLRAIGSTSKNITVYVLSIIAYTTLIGAGIGFLLGKLVSLAVLKATDFTLGEWLRMAAYDALLSLSGLGISLVLGLAVAMWASRIPCAEVLRRE